MDERQVAELAEWERTGNIGAIKQKLSSWGGSTDYDAPFNQELHNALYRMEQAPEQRRHADAMAAAQAANRESRKATWIAIAAIAVSIVTVLVQLALWMAGG